MFTETLTLPQLLISLGITAAGVLVAVLFYYVIRGVLHRFAGRTGTELDNMLVKSLEWPAFAGIVLAGAYFAIVTLPLEAGPDFQVRRAFHAGFIVIGAVVLWAFLDALFRWFKLEVTPHTRTALDDWIVILLRVLTPIVVGLFAALACLALFGVNTATVTSWLVQHGTRIILIVALAFGGILVLGVAGSRAIEAVVARGAGDQPEEEVHKRADTLSRVLITAGQVFIIFVAVFIVLSELNVDIAPVLAGAGVVGIAIGFGAQSLVKDLVAGFFVVMENQYRVGDVVTIAGVSGLVEEINLRRTVLRDLDGTVHVVPNGEVRVASNLSKQWARVNLNISVSYGTDLDHAIAVINRVCAQMAAEPEWAPRIIKAPQVLRVDKLGDSGIDLKVLGDTRPLAQWDVMGEIRKRVKKACDDEGIEIPYPHTKVYFGNAPPPAAPGQAK